MPSSGKETLSNGASTPHGESPPHAEHLRQGPYCGPNRLLKFPLSSQSWLPVILSPSPPVILSEAKNLYSGLRVNSAKNLKGIIRDSSSPKAPQNDHVGVFQQPLQHLIPLTLEPSNL